MLDPGKVGGCPPDQLRPLLIQADPAGPIHHLKHVKVISCYHYPRGAGGADLEVKPNIQLYLLPLMSAHLENLLSCHKRPSVTLDDT